MSIIDIFAIMKYRIFIASHIPNNLKKVFIDYQQRKLIDPCFRLVSQESLHLTLIFIGFVKSNDLLKINQVCQDTISLFSPIEIKFNEIVYGPNSHSPRLVWAKGEISKELNQLRETLENKLIDQGINIKVENRLFKPHITLARLREKPSSSLKIEEKIDKSFIINCISVMQTELTNQGPKYTDLSTYSFNK